MASRPEDVLGLLIPMFSGSKDDYGKDVVPPCLLSFDRVNEGRPPKSTAMLFQLPFEILGAINQRLHPTSMASLALVNTDCRQLTRSRRFASVKLDYSDESMWLVQMLLKEGEERRENNGLTLLPSLGACIRRLQIATDPQNVSSRHNIDLATLGDIGEDAKKQRLGNAHAGFFGSYIPAIQYILPHALPHLELLDWEDKISIPRSFFNALACSSIQHLKLYRISIDEEFGIELPGALAHRGWPLRTLHLELHWNPFARDKGRISPMCTSILRHCAPTLESLTWTTLRGAYIYEDIQSVDLEGLEPPRFAHLRDLKLGRLKVSDSTLGLLLHSEPQIRLQVLDVDTDSDPVRAQFFKSRGTINSLETFVWYALRVPGDHTLSFLRSNPQLSKFSIPFSQSSDLLETRLLPILSKSFQKLTSLALSWQDVSISNSALEHIGTLQSLQQLCLSAGEQFGWKHEWVIEHRTMRKYLGKLQGLRRIAFERDTYRIGRVNAEHYYEIRAPETLGDAEDGEDGEDAGDEDPDQRMDRLWEQQHRKRILSEADEYVRLLPELQWLYFGQIPMSVADSGGPRGRKAVALSGERDSCRTLLRRMFGRENAAD